MTKIKLIVAILRGHAAEITVGYTTGYHHVTQTFLGIELVDRRQAQRIPDSAVYAQQN
jgi:hypothetical protein